MEYADYGFYKDAYGGNDIPEASFKRYAVKSSAYLDAVTFGRVELEISGKHGDKIKLACCSVADAYFLNEKGGGVVSETVGKLSRNYAAGISNTPSESQRLKTAASTYLANTSLLYRGC